MGTVLEMETFRQKSAGPSRTKQYGADHALFSDIKGLCPGCGARRSFLVAFHDTGTDAGTDVFSRTLPHYVCDGERVIEQEMPENPGSD